MPGKAVKCAFALTAAWIAIQALISIFPARAEAQPAKLEVKASASHALVLQTPSTELTQAKAMNATAAVAATATVSQPPRLYRNPLRHVSGLVPNRIDQGVDYWGHGPVYSLGHGRVIFMCNGCWWQGWYIAVRLDTGRLAGRVTYLAEGVVPRVHIGEEVTNQTVIGYMYGGIETGWADGHLLPDTMARATGEYGFPTHFGEMYSWLLHHLGAPPGVG